VVSDLVQDDVPDPVAKHVGVVPVQALERPAVDRDLVWQHARVTTVSSRERDPLVETQQWLSARRLVLDHDLDVRDPIAKLVGERVESCEHDVLEIHRADPIVRVQ
jgi:hypothetical protein